MENFIKWIFGLLIGTVITVLFTRYLNNSLPEEEHKYIKDDTLKVIIVNPIPNPDTTVTNDEFKIENEDKVNSTVEITNDDEIADDSEKESNDTEVTEDKNANKTTTININYRGDNLGCALYLNIEIGGMSFTPTGYTFRVSGIPIGRQYYSINATANCFYYGSYLLTGTGYINVIPNKNYYVNWGTDGYNQTYIKLSDN